MRSSPSCKASSTGCGRCTREGRELILCGDINIARADIDVHPKERKPGIIGQRDEERALFEALLGDSLIDVTRALDPDNAALFTWWPPWRDMRKRNIGWRIDYILASRAIADAGDGVQSPGRRRHQRSRADHDDGVALKRGASASLVRLPARVRWRTRTCPCHLSAV